MASAPVRRTGPGGTRVVTPATTTAATKPGQPAAATAPRPGAAPPGPGGRPAPPATAPATAPHDQADDQADDDMPDHPPAAPPAAAKRGGASDLLAHHAREAGRSLSYELLSGYADLVMSAIGTDASTTADLLRQVADELDPPPPVGGDGSGG